MTKLQHTRSTLPLYVCELCGIADDINKDCTACLVFEMQLEYDRLQELYLDDMQDRSDMSYVDGFGEDY